MDERKKIYRKLFELCALVGLPKLALVFYRLSSYRTEIKPGFTVYSSSSRANWDWLKDIDPEAKKEDEFPF